MLTFDDVNETHKSLSGVYVKDGRVISILLSSQARHRQYDNQISDKEITYHIRADREPGKAWEKAMADMMGKDLQLKVFYKHKTNHWELLGGYVVVERSRTNQDCFFKLAKR